MTNESVFSGCCSPSIERVDCACRSRSAALLAEARVGVGLHLGAPSPHALAAVCLPWKGCGAARCVLRELAEAAVVALSGMLGCGCVCSRRGELWLIVNALRAHSRA